MPIERKKAVRVVLDTSVWVSALLWTGLPHQLLKLIEKTKIIVVISPVLVKELREVLGVINLRQFWLRVKAVCQS